MWIWRSGRSTCGTAIDAVNRRLECWFYDGTEASGGKAQAYQALQKATTEATQGMSGQFEKVVQVAGQNVTVTGKMIDGVARIGTAFIPN